MNSGSYAWSNVASFAPQLTLKVPASPPTCHTIALVSLPPALYFDPFTARLSEAQLVRSAKLFGTLDLEKPVGWTKRNTTARSIETIPRMWWEGDQGEASEAVCVDEACEYSTLLLVLDGSTNLAQYLDAFMLYESASMPEAETSSAIEMPVGNASLNLVVHLITLGTALFASLLLGRSILSARRHAN